MKPPMHRHPALAIPASVTTAFLLWSFISSAWAQNAPGEDPVVLTKKIAVQMLPIGGARASSPMNPQTAMPAWMQAKVARFEAKANAEQSDDILTNSDVVRTANADGLKKTCIQEVGSNTAQSPGKFGLPNTQQIVVLKGDLINICK